MKLIRPKGEKLSHAQLVKRAGTYRALETALYRSNGNEFADKLQSRFHKLAVQYEERADAFLIELPPLGPPLRL